MDGASGKHPLAEIGELVVHLELVEDVEGVRDETFDARKPVIPTLRGGPKRQELDIGVIRLLWVKLAAVPSISRSTRSPRSPPTSPTQYLSTEYCFPCKADSRVSSKAVVDERQSFFFSFTFTD